MIKTHFCSSLIGSKSKIPIGNWMAWMNWTCKSNITWIQFDGIHIKFWQIRTFNLVRFHTKLYNIFSQEFACFLQIWITFTALNFFPDLAKSHDKPLIPSVCCSHRCHELHWLQILHAAHHGPCTHLVAHMYNSLFWTEWPLVLKL